jgi:hypothetical protein
MGWIFKVSFLIALSAIPSMARMTPAATSSGEQGTTLTKEYACGGAGKSPCPLQGWMRTTLDAAAVRGDSDALAKGFDFLASKPPPGYTEWTRIAKEGAGLARKKDIDGARQSCKTCHGKYKSRYKEELRDRAL